MEQISKISYEISHSGLENEFCYKQINRPQQILSDTKIQTKLRDSDEIQKQYF